MQIQNNIPEIMLEKEISGYRLAKDLELNEAYVYSKIKKPDFNPNISTAFKISKYLGVEIDELFTIKK